MAGSCVRELYTSSKRCGRGDVPHILQESDRLVRSFKLRLGAP
ncbi:MAG: hypothetical protein ACJAYX_003124 [Planctomycetota bacterium]|jgi:hypothetical protein